MSSAISHITFIVKDIEKTAKLFEFIFGAKIIYSSGPRTFSISPEIFLSVNGLWIALMQGEPPAERSYNHVAFKVGPGDFAEFARRVKESGAEIKEGRSRIGGEADSLYFYDYDNHLFEIHSGTVEERLESYERTSSAPAER
jgi:catechol 2,3-dioxygenase-like lactoylglutathione lyase family enzyme